MSALGVMLIGFGILTVWSGLDKVFVTDVLRSLIGAPATPKTPAAATASTPTPAPQTIPNAPAPPTGPVTV